MIAMNRAELRTFVSPQRRFKICLGKNTVTDGKARVYWWSMTNTMPDDNEKTIKPNGYTDDQPGRWIAVGFEFFIENVFGLQTALDALDAKASLQSDYTQADNTKGDFIKNKPTIPDAQIQTDYTQTDNTKKDFLKNKPTLFNGAYSSLTGVPATFPPSPHTHPWSEVTGKPTTFPPSVHTHAISDITDLQTTLDSLPKAKFVQLADALVTTAADGTTEKSLIGTGNGSMTFAAGSLVAGKTIRITVRGVYSTPTINLTSLLVKIKLGTTILAQGTASSLLLGANNNSYEGSGLMTIRSAGAAGSEVLAANVNYSTGNNAVRNFLELSNSGSPVTINTTIANLLDVTVQWQGTASGHAIKSTVTILETLN